MAVNVLYVYVIDKQKIIDMRMMRHVWFFLESDTQKRQTHDSIVGARVGASVGSKSGLLVGRLVGFFVGFLVGLLDGLSDGLLVGLLDGLLVDG